MTYWMYCVDDKIWHPLENGEREILNLCTFSGVDPTDVDNTVIGEFNYETRKPLQIWIRNYPVKAGGNDAS